MSAHRYWRLSFTSADGNSNVLISDVEFRQTTGGVDETGSGTAAANNAIAGTSAAAAFDNSIGTYWSISASGAWLSYDFGAGVTKDIQEVAIACGIDVTKAPNTFVVQYSDDNSTWTTSMSLSSISGWREGEQRIFSAAGQTGVTVVAPAARYWRLVVKTTNGASNASIAELGLRTSIGGATVTSGGTPFSNNFVLGHDSTNAFDASSSTYWESSTALEDYFVGYDFGASNDKTIVQMAVTANNFDATMAPSLLYLQRSVNGLAWSTSITADAQTWTTGQTKTFGLTTVSSGTSHTLDLQYFGQPNYLVWDVGNQPEYSLDRQYFGEPVTTYGQTSTLTAALNCQSTATSALTTSITMGSSLGCTSAIRDDQAHRYWRLYVYLSNYSVVQIPELQFREFVGAANICTGGTASASSVNSTNVAANAFDGDATNTKWMSTSATNEWLAYDLGAGVSKHVREIVITNGSALVQSLPYSFAVQSSDDGTTWTDEWYGQITSLYTTNASFTFAAPEPACNTPAHRYWSINIPSTQGGTSAPTVAEVEFHGTAGGADLATGGTAFQSPLSFSAGTPANAFDGSASTTWGAGGGPYSGGQQISYDFGSATTIVETALTAAASGAVTGMPTAFSLRYSDDGLTWRTYFSITGIGTWTNGLTRTYNTLPANLYAPMAASATVTATLSTGIQMAAALHCVATETSALTAQTHFSANLFCVSSSSSALSTSISAAASLTADSSLTASLTTNIRMAAAVADAASLSSALTTDIKAAASLAATSTVSATLTGQIQFAASLADVAAVSSSLSTSTTGTASLAASSSITASLSTSITAAAALASTSTVTADLTTVAGSPLAAALQASASLSATLTTRDTAAALLAASSTLAGALTTGIRLASSVQSVATLSGSLPVTLFANLTCQSTCVVTVARTDIPLQAALLCDAETTSDLATDIQMACPMQQTFTVSADLTAPKNAASLAASLKVVATVSIPKNPGLKTGKNLKTTMKVGSITGCQCTLTADLRTSTTMATAMQARSTFAPPNLVCEAHFAAALASESTVTPNAVFRILMASVMQSQASFNASAPNTDITMATDIGAVASVTPPNLRCGVFFDATLSSVSTLTPGMVFKLTLKATLSGEAALAADLDTRPFAHFSTQLVCQAAAQGALVTDIRMQADPMVSGSAAHGDLHTNILMTATLSGVNAQVAADITTNILLAVDFLGVQASFGQLRVYKRALIIKNGKLRQVPFGEEGTHTLAAMKNGYITDGATGPALYQRLGIIYESTPEDDIIV